MNSHTTQDIDVFCDGFKRAEQEIGRVIVGNEAPIRAILTSLLGGGHVLLEGIPGVGKTQIVKTISEVLNLKFSRIQFTPDLMPGDIIGTYVVRETETGQKTLDFQPGPVFGNVILADEVNRATPKTQSALLEAMQEQSVTVGKTTHPVGSPFFVLATQNPLEMEGTYPLPEAQLDRFFFKVHVDFPDRENLHLILERTTQAAKQEVAHVLDRDQILHMREVVRAVPIARPVQDYAIRLTLATHPQREDCPEAVKRYVRFGASPRGAQALVIGAKVNALLNGRLHVASEDVATVCHPALRHRVLLNFEGEAERVDIDQMLNEVLASVEKP